MMKRLTLLVLSLLFTGALNAQEKTINPHEQQSIAPHKMLELAVSQTETVIVQASTKDLNVLYTPFLVAHITHNTNESFTVDSNKIYFQSSSTSPFSIFVTEQGDSDAPQYKIMFVPTQSPMGYQIKLEPKTPYFPKQGQANERRVHKAHSFRQQIIATLSDTAKYLATEDTERLPDNFIIDSRFKSEPYFIGNVLVTPEIRLEGNHYEIFVLTANNRSDVRLELVNQDFATLNPTTGLLENADVDSTADGVGFYPNKNIQPGQSTQVLLMRALDY
jgi:hypothetical protein